MRLSDLQDKDVVNLDDGKVIGRIIDVIIDDKVIINKLVVERYKFIISRFTNGNEIEISWNQINKIGEDVILVLFS